MCDKWGIIWSVCAVSSSLVFSLWLYLSVLILTRILYNLQGFSVGCAEMLSFVVSGMGVQATQSIPTIIGEHLTSFSSSLNNLSCDKTFINSPYSRSLSL